MPSLTRSRMYAWAVVGLTIASFCVATAPGASAATQACSWTLYAASSSSVTASNKWWKRVVRHVLFRAGASSTVLWVKCVFDGHGERKFSKFLGLCWKCEFH